MRALACFGHCGAASGAAVASRVGADVLRQRLLRLPVLISGHPAFRCADRILTARMPIHVVLVHPEIHWNTGNAGRSCLAAGATLHLVEPLGFSLDEREVRRAGLDYWPHVELRVWSSWPDFERELPSLGSPFFFSTRGSRRHWEVEYPEDAVLVFGRETGGLPDEIHARYGDRMLSMPIRSPHVRSLNLSTTVGIALYEVLRQHARTQ
jgi:tRNA (cytidine/uridine-2'-O-)-methyltransferase